MLENLHLWVLDPGHIRVFLHIAVLGVGGFWLTCILGRLLERSLLPHIGSGSAHTRQAMGQLVADNLVAWFTTGRPLTPVPECGDLPTTGR